MDLAISKSVPNKTVDKSFQRVYIKSHRF